MVATKSSLIILDQSEASADSYGKSSTSSIILAPVRPVHRKNVSSRRRADDLQVPQRSSPLATTEKFATSITLTLVLLVDDDSPVVATNPFLLAPDDEGVQKSPSGFDNIDNIQTVLKLLRKASSDDYPGWVHTSSSPQDLPFVQKTRASLLSFYHILVSFTTIIMKFFTGIITVLPFVTYIVALPILITRDDSRLSQSTALERLEQAGITHTDRNGGCPDEGTKGCTSYDQAAVDWIIKFKETVGLDSLVITGGADVTEFGHSRHSTLGEHAHAHAHGNRWKLDIERTDKVTNYIKNTFKYHGKRGDGYDQWISPSGNIYCDELTHWDITVLTGSVDP